MQILPLAIDWGYWLTVEYLLPHFDTTGQMPEPIVLPHVPDFVALPSPSCSENKSESLRLQ